MLPFRFLVCVFLAMSALPAAGDDEGDPSAPERIEALRTEAERLRDEADAAYQAAEAACYKRFLVNRCIDDSKAERLAAIRRARALETEAYNLDLAERRRAAAEAKKRAEERGAPPRPTAAAMPTADVATPTMPNVDASPPIAPRAASAKKKRERAKARKQAGTRAKSARHDRERYDARIRELEEKKARDADGR
ncbi:MAG: hypothetical protein LBR95_06165 [Azoarcus sp.]|jgi:hypothetical protein|nr:hypothetical protein [Azoarcus sp.]